jgi:peptide/nickel transport system permease protein
MTGKQLILYVARRLVGLAAVLFVISFGVFALQYLAPGSVVQAMVGDHPVDAATLQTLTERYHLNDPFIVQYWHWLVNAFQLDFGKSIQTGQDVWPLLVQRLTTSLYLGLFAFAIALVLGLTLGVTAGLRKGSAADRAIVGISVAGVSAPAFVTGVLLLYVFTVVLPWFPSFGVGAGVGDRLYHLALPAFALALTGTALIVKLTRAAVADVVHQDYITFARARGLPSPLILGAYVIRNALVPIVTSAGLVLGFMLTGTVLVESTFALPGLGSLLVDAVNFKDVPVVQGLAMLLAVIIVVINLVTDLVYFAVDPQIRVEKVQS